jgi:hypothetical protein
MAYEQFLSVAGLYEGPIRALVDQYEVAATDHDAGVQARAQVALDYDIILLGTANGDARGELVHHQLAVIEPQPQTHAALTRNTPRLREPWWFLYPCPWSYRDRRLPDGPSAFSLAWT